MRSVYDLKNEQEKLDLGMALSPIVQAFADQDPAQPLGSCWEALVQLLEDMERRAISGVGHSAQATVMQRAAAKLFGLPIPNVTPSAEAYARLDGQLEALRAVRETIPAMVFRAIQAYKPNQPTAAKAEQPQRRAQPTRPGSSFM